MKKFVNEIGTPKKLWKPPSFEDFHVESPSKRIKLKESECSFQEILIDEPKNVEDLAVHGKKIEEVQNWFVCALCGEYGQAPMLLVTGPTGCGKTTTITVITKLLKLTVLEWINPIDKNNFDMESHNERHDPCMYSESSQLDKFLDFIFRSSKYKTLFESDRKNQILLVKDFPNLFFMKPNIFHNFLTRYNTEGKSPIIFISTETHTFNYTNELFPLYVRNNLTSMTHIKFNPVSKTLLVKLINSKFKNCNMNKKINSLKTLSDSLSSNAMGDIRTAVSSLQLMSVKKNFNSQSDSNLCLRDDQIDFYQLLGRILYPKKKTDSVSSKKLKSSVVDIEGRNLLYDVNDISEKLMDFQNSNLLLHENYIDTFSSISDITEASSFLSYSDIFNMYTDKDVLNVYKNYIITCGLMISNVVPKKGSFKPIRKSEFLNVSKSCQISLLEDMKSFSDLKLSNHCLHLQMIPYMKCFPQFQIRLNTNVINRFESNLMSSQTSCIDRKMLPKCNNMHELVTILDDDDDENDNYVIEDSDD